MDENTLNQTPMRRTKIIATLGPASQTEAVLRAMIVAGVDVVRVNMSHGSVETHVKQIETVRQLAEEVGRIVAIMLDLQGPKIRIARFAMKKVTLKKGRLFCLDASLGEEQGDETQVGIDYPSLPNDVKSGDILLLDDGRLVLTVLGVKAKRIECQVVVGGELSNNKGINRQGGGLSADALTDKDKQDILIAAQLEVDYVALSFPRNAADVKTCQALLKAAGSKAYVVAKIERVEAVETIDEIILASAVVMVARGDLGVEIGDAQLPAVQKHIIYRARHLNKGVIVATQMMESMVSNVIPTRAEVFDVANAVLDGTDAVMLSSETAVGIDPANAIRAMSRICVGAEKERKARLSRHRIDEVFKSIAEGIAMAAMYLGNQMPVKAIVALTESGSTPILMSRIRSGIPIIAISRHQTTCLCLALYRGVYPHQLDLCNLPEHATHQTVLQFLQDRHFLDVGDLVIMTRGDVIGAGEGSNTMKLLRVGEMRW
jgi:pyruvate kinase